MLPRNELLHGGVEGTMDLTTFTRRGRVDQKDPVRPGKARWRDRVILAGRVQGFGRGWRVWRRPEKVTLGKKWVETEDEGKFSCEKLRVFLAVLFVVAVCQNTLQKFKFMQTYRTPNFRASGIYLDPPFGMPIPGWGPTELPINHLWWPLCYEIARITLHI